MNFNDRGITVGDLLIILIITLSTITIIKSFNKDNKSTFNTSNQYKYILLNNHSNNDSV